MGFLNPWIYKHKDTVLRREGTGQAKRTVRTKGGTSHGKGSVLAVKKVYSKKRANRKGRKFAVE
jgi:hypothetical protein